MRATPSSRTTFAELDDRSAQLAARLVKAGIVKGSRADSPSPNEIDWAATCSAALLGAIIVPVTTFYQASELARFLRHADLQFLLGIPAFPHHDYIPRLESAAPELAGHGRLPTACGTKAGTRVHDQICNRCGSRARLL